MTTLRMNLILTVKPGMGMKLKLHPGRLVQQSASGGSFRESSGRFDLLRFHTGRISIRRDSEDGTGMKLKLTVKKKMGKRMISLCLPQPPRSMLSANIGLRCRST